MAAKRKPSSYIEPAAVWDGCAINGCINGDGRVIEAACTLVAKGSVWVLRSELKKALDWGWKPTGVEKPEMVVVRR